ncbi:MAG TPA: DUF5615 family PIN-like protein [Chloroflexia bacterium]
MLRLAADENFNNIILRGARRRNPGIDIVRVQDVGPVGADDPTVLEWAAQEGRILLTHDSSTLIGFAYARVASGQPMPGVLAVKRTVPITIAIEDILLIAECGEANEWEGLVRYLPL